MAQVSHRMENDTLIISLVGKLDSTNAADTEEQINAVRAANPASAVVLDCDELDYISSAGLRVVLRLKKAVPDTRLVNASSAVYEILEMTGFTEMMDVEKAMRVFSVEGCEVIGEGVNGKVYRIDADTIVKVYVNPDSLPEIHRERELARTAFVLGVPTAIPYDVVRVEGGGYGSVFELLNAKSFGKLLVTGERSLDEVAKMMVDLLLTIHSTEVDPASMPDMREVALDWVSQVEDSLPPEYHAKLKRLVEAVPQDNHMLHGDYHLKNVMLQNGESLLIDMDTLCHGHPVFEFGGIFNAYQGFSDLDHTVVERFQGISYEDSTRLWNTMLELYFAGKDPAFIQGVKDKAQVMGFTRLLRRMRRQMRAGVEGAREQYEHYQRRLVESLDKVDSLTF